MPDSEEMTIDERRKCIKRMQASYLGADPTERGRLLSHLEELDRVDRVGPQDPDPGQAAVGRARGVRAPGQRGRVYGIALDDALRVIWETLDDVCAERLTPALVPTARRLAAHGELVLTDELVAQLGRISIASIQRRLTRWGRTPPACRARGQSGQRVARGDPDAADPLGHGRAATSRSIWSTSGPSTHGDYVHTLQLVDVATGWSERVAVLGRSQRAMEHGFHARAAALPDPRAAPDNGPEFLNAHLVRFWGAAITGLTLSRSRPYHKNDNRLVEQKNDTLVRAYVGHGRLDTPQQCAALNALVRADVELLQPVPAGGFVLHLVEDPR